MIKVKKFEKSEINEARKICFKHYLYVPSWSFQMWLTHRYYQNRIKQIFIVYKDKIPVGASIVLTDESDVNVGFFVKPQYRRLGLGKRLMKSVSENNKEQNLYYDYGIPESLGFFENTTKKLDNIAKVF